MLRSGLRRGLTGIVVALTGTLAAVPAFAQDPTTNTGDTAWLITATGLKLAVVSNWDVSLHGVLRETGLDRRELARSLHMSQTVF